MNRFEVEIQGKYMYETSKMCYFDWIVEPIGQNNQNEGI